MFPEKKSRMIRLICLISLFSVFNHSEAKGSQLDLLIDRAMRENPDIVAAFRKMEALKQEVIQEKALEDPELTLTQYEAPSNFDLSNPAQSWYGIGQAFPFPGKRAMRGKIAGKEVEVQFQTLQATIRETILKIKTAYYQIFLANQGIDIHLAHQTLLDEFTRSAQQKYITGMGTQQDIVKAEVELSKLHNSLLALEQEKVNAESTLNVLLNRPPDSALEISEDPSSVRFKYTLEELTPSVLKNRPEVMTVNLQIEKEEMSLSLAEKYRYPDFMAELTYMQSHRGEENKWMALAKVNLPWIFNQKYQAKINQIRLEKEAREAELKGMENQSLAELRILYSKIKSLETSLDMYRNGILPQAEQALKASRIAYQAGKSDLLNVIDSERTLKDLEMNYFETLVALNLRISELEKLTGKELK